ncbi:MAG: serine acetyltransferase [Spirochaetales bacterium]|nr:serine acetyltransferase [Spirochaetales bacterium]
MKHKYHLSFDNCIGKQGRDEIFSILDDFLALLFPGSFRSKKTSIDDLSFIIDDTLRHAGIHLYTYLSDMYCGAGHKNPEKKSQENVQQLLESLPLIRSELVEDIEAALKGDPAAHSLDEIVLSYPFVEAISTYRIAHNLYVQDVPIVPRIMTERAHSRTGIDIHPGAKIAPGFFIDHGTGVVIGETCTIGKNVILYQGVTLGATSPFDKDGSPLRNKKRHPDIEDNVIIYANATILGGNTVIGKGSIIGGNTWITTSIPSGSVVYRSQNYNLKQQHSHPSD